MKKFRTRPAGITREVDKQMTEAALLFGLALMSIFSLILATYVVITSRTERQELVDRLMHREQDILDRLMAKSLPEVKYAQREPEQGVVTSKRRNDARVTDEHMKIAKG